MHGNTPVASFSQLATGRGLKIKEIYSQELFPEQTEDKSIGLQKWILNRSKPVHQGKIAEAKNFYGDRAFTSRTLRSLMDCYWVNSLDDPKEWDEINPRTEWDPEFDSVFLMLYDPSNLEGIDEDSPNLTIPGKSPEVWGNINDSIVLLNESAQKDIARYRIASSSGLEVVAPRSYIIKKGCVFSYREVDVDDETERIPLDLYYNAYADPSLKKEENLSRCFSAIGLSDWKDFIMGVLAFDKKCNYKSRDLSSLGIIRNMKTLECIGFDRI